MRPERRSQYRANDQKTKTTRPYRCVRLRNVVYKCVSLLNVYVSVCTPTDACVRMRTRAYGFLRLRTVVYAWVSGLYTCGPVSTRV